MTKKQALFSAAVSSLIAIGGLTAAGQASAQDMEKCYGVVAAGSVFVSRRRPRRDSAASGVR